MTFYKSKIAAKNLLRIKIVLVFVCGIELAGCSKYAFQPNGTVINGRSDLYINDSAKLCLDLFGDYQIYSAKIMKGLKVNSFYPADKSMLRALGFSKAKTSVLFSVEPVISPFHHIIALLRDSSDVRLARYQYRNIFDTVKYFYRKPEMKEFEVEETLISYRDQFIEFVYYNNKINDCSYCDIEILTEKNSYRIIKGKQFDYQACLSECGVNPSDGKSLSIDIPPGKVLSNKMGLLMVYKLNPITKERKFEAFKLLRPQKSHIDLNVCKGDHLIIYMDLEHHKIWSSQI